MKKGIWLLAGFIFLIAIFSINTISAEIMLSQPKSIYNLGDTIELNTVIKPSQQASGFFELNLYCGNESKNFYREPLSLEAEEEKQITSSLSLTRSFLGNLIGQCKIKARFLAEERESQGFEITDKLNVVLNIDSMSVEAGEEIILRGTAIRGNGEDVEGFVEISVENIDLKVIRAVNEGAFEINFSFPENTKASNYILNARVYEKSLEEETNTGEAKLTLNIKKKPSKIEISILKQNIVPGENLTFSPIIYDQANEQVAGEVSARIYDSYDGIIFQNIIGSGEKKSIYLETNSSPGYWRIEASGLGLEAKRLFYVEELEKARFEIINDTLIITNTGNVVYRRAIQISIGEVVEIKNLDLDIGESKKLRLVAPEGNYVIRISDGKESEVFGDVFLTGKAIGVEDIRGTFSTVTKYPIIWIFLIAVLGIFIVMLIQRLGKKRFVAYPVKAKEVEVSGAKRSMRDFLGKRGRKGKEKRVRIEKEGDIKVTGVPGKAEHTLVLKGRKEKTGILTVKIKEMNIMKKIARETIDQIFKEIVDNKGTIYETGDYIIGIFSSATTKTFDNEMLAVKIARQVNELLKEHNRKFREKMVYGISLNSGELIVKKEKDGLRFTSIGSTINLAKKIAEIADSEVLLSEPLQQRVMSQIKSEKEVRQGVNVYHIKRIVDRDKHKGFIFDFLSRQQNKK